MKSRIAMLMVLAGLAGCNRGPAPGPPPPPRLSPLDDARSELFRIAKKHEDAANYQALETYLSYYEDPAKGWTIADLGEVVMSGSYSIETKRAFERWRHLRLGGKDIKK